MFKGFKKIRILIFVFGLFAFFVLAASTVIEGDLDNDYISFQILRNYINVNRFSIINNKKNQIVLRDRDINAIVHEIDLSYYIFKDSTIFTYYRYINKAYNNSFTIIEKKWDSFAEAYFIQGTDDAAFNDALYSIHHELNKLNDILSTFESRWQKFYMVVLSVNLLIFLLLLIFVFILSKGVTGGSTNSLMSVRNALIEGQEQERLRISLELHDKVAQDLFACRMVIKDISSNLKDETLTPSIDKSLALLDTSIKEVRDLSYSLRPPALQAIGLDSAIQSYIDNFVRKIETPVTFKSIGLTNKVIDEKISINLYRILQETLNNTVKHAHAQKIDVKLIYTYPYLLLKIEDDGVGFKYVKSEIKAKGGNKLGLPGINERVSLIGGELIINTEKGEGTKILIKVPVAANEKV